jgi:hypothetical protein
MAHLGDAIGAESLDPLDNGAQNASFGFERLHGREMQLDPEGRRPHQVRATSRIT